MSIVIPECYFDIAFVILILASDVALNFDRQDLTLLNHI